MPHDTKSLPMAGWACTTKTHWGGGASTEKLNTPSVRERPRFGLTDDAGGTFTGISHHSSAKYILYLCCTQYMQSAQSLVRQSNKVIAAGSAAAVLRANSRAACCLVIPSVRLRGTHGVSGVKASLGRHSYVGQRQ
jgi:hypothetical protein